MERRGRLDPAVADVRRAVRESLREIARLERGGPRAEGEGRPLVLVALSGGADSLALASALAFEGPKQGFQCGCITIDHQLQAESARVAHAAAQQAKELGLAPVLIEQVTVDTQDPAGREAAARTARYKAFALAAARTNAQYILTAHTLSDQAEQVMLGLLRGSGIASLSGIPYRRDIFLRPFLKPATAEITRETTRKACSAQGFFPWEDPHNESVKFMRVLTRKTVLPFLQKTYGIDIARNLAATAQLLAADGDFLRQETERAFTTATASSSSHPDADLVLQVAALTNLHPAIRSRVLRLAAQKTVRTSLTRTHTEQIDRLLTNWRGQKPLHLPALRVWRVKSELFFKATSSDTKQHKQTKDIKSHRANES